MIIAEVRVNIPKQVNNIRESLKRAMLRIVIGLQRYIVLNKLSGQVLHHRTGNLARAITYLVETNGSEVVGTVGVSRQAPYGKTHELGGDFNIPEHNRRSVLGNIHTVRGYIMHVPERSFLRTSLRENNPSIREQLAGAV